MALCVADADKLIGVSRLRFVLAESVAEYRLEAGVDFG